MIKDYIEKNGIKVLTDNLGISIKEYGDFYVLNYSQIDSPKTDPIVMASRGTIITKDTYKIVCNPFGRFFNYGETEEHVVDWTKASVKEKVDGSLIKLWWNRIGNRWEIATRGTAFGESNVGDFGLTFRELFLRVIHLSEVDFQKVANCGLDHGCTYLLELACLENRVVTSYEKDQIVLLAIRDNTTGNYLDKLSFEHTTFSSLGVRDVKEFSLGSIEEVKAASEALTGLQEGFVVYQGNTPLFKIKSPTYVIAHHLRGEGLTNKRVAKLIWINEEQEYLSYFPQDTAFILPWMDAHLRMLGDILDTYETTQNIENQKDFALVVKDKPVASVLFNMRKGFTLENSLSRVLESNYVNILSHYLTKGVIS